MSKTRANSSKTSSYMELFSADSSSFVTFSYLWTASLSTENRYLSSSNTTAELFGGGVTLSSCFTVSLISLALTELDSDGFSFVVGGDFFVVKAFVVRSCEVEPVVVSGVSVAVVAVVPVVVAVVDVVAKVTSVVVLSDGYATLMAFTSVSCSFNTGLVKLYHEYITESLICECFRPNA